MTLRHERAERHTIQIRKGDNVKVIAGKDAGKSGRVLSVNAAKNTVVVEHVGIIKRHTRPNPSKNIKGGIIEKEAGINVSNVMVVPKLQKITVNIGMGEASQNVKLLDTAAQELGQITGQKAVITRAKKSIANFKIRRGMPIGCAVTLRGDHMYEFLDRLCNVVLPRVRDFRGLPSNAFDGRGNYTLGLKDQLVFPEIDYTRVDKIKGMNITLTTAARNDEEGRELLKGLGFPLRTPGVAQ